jgi:glutamate synthase domain-containing protein 3
MCNHELVLIEKPSVENMKKVKRMITEHYQYTESIVAKEILDDWAHYKNHFSRVIPSTYKEITEKNNQETKVS